MFDYEEACPISKASSILCERWTLQIIREMHLGATRFSEFQKFLPKLSPTLLNTRLKMLESQGIIIRKKTPEKRSHEYQLTPAGLALKPVLTEIGKWGMNWAFDNMDPEQLNASAIVRDYAVALNLDQLPAGDATIQFNITESGNSLKKFIMIRDNSPQVCDENLGLDVDVYLTADLETFGRIWYGKINVISACDSGILKVVGSNFYVKNISNWLGTSQFAPFKSKKI